MFEEICPLKCKPNWWEGTRPSLPQVDDDEYIFVLQDVLLNCATRKSNLCAVY